MRVEQRLLASWLESRVPPALAEWHLPVVQPSAAWPGWQTTPTPGLLQLMREARALDRMGCALPEAVAASALRQAAHANAVRRVGAMLARATSLHASLSEEQRVLYGPQLGALQAVLSRGGVTWTSLTLPAYLEQCDQVGGLRHMQGSVLLIVPTQTVAQAVAALESQVAQLARHAAPLYKAVASIAATPLLPDAPSDAPPLADLVALVARHQAALVPALLHAHQRMAAALRAVERVVCGTATGKSPGMAAWYTHWEGALCGALVTMVHNGVLQRPPQACR